MSSIPVLYSKSVGVLSCGSIIAQSRIIDKVYWISRLQNALWNCYFLTRLLFQSLSFLRSLLILFCKSYFFKGCSLIEQLIFNKKPRGLLDVKVPGGGGGGGHRVMHYSKIFPLNSMTKTFASKLLSQDSIEQHKLLTNAKMFYFWGI